MNNPYGKSSRAKIAKFFSEYGWCLLAIVIVTIAALGVFSLFGISKEFERDKDTGCLANKPYDSVVVLVDKSSAYSEVFAGNLKRFFDEVERNLSEESKFTVYQLTEDSGNQIVPIMSRCFPRKTANEKFENQKSIDKLFQLFTEAKQRTIEKIKASKTTKTSPIIETIKLICDLHDEFRDKSRRNTLFIISDFMENSTLASHYGRHSQEYYLDFQDINAFIPQLQGTDVRLRYLVRAKQGQSQTPEHKAFWKDYFRLAKAKSVELIPYREKRRK